MCVGVGASSQAPHLGDLRARSGAISEQLTRVFNGRREQRFWCDFVKGVSVARVGALVAADSACCCDRRRRPCGK